MTTNAIATSASTSSTRKLAAVPSARRQVGQVPFVIMWLTFLGIGMSGVLVLNVTLQNQGFEVRAAQVQARELGYQEEALTSLLIKMRSPSAVAERAERLGMVPNNKPAYLKLPSGEVKAAGQDGTAMSSQKRR